MLNTIGGRNTISAASTLNQPVIEPHSGLWEQFLEQPDNKRLNLPVLRCHGPCMRTSRATSARRLAASRYAHYRE